MDCIEQIIYILVFLAHPEASAGSVTNSRSDIYYYNNNYMRLCQCRNHGGGGLEDPGTLAKCLFSIYATGLCIMKADLLYDVCIVPMT